MSKISKKIASELNKEQIEAVGTLEGPLLVLAGAGTGKTRVITYRIAHMINSGIAPKSIAGMTFTNKASREMRERLSSVVSASVAEKVFLGTFHSFCARFLRKEITVLGYTRSFTIADETDQNGILKQILAEMNIQKELVNVSHCLSLIGKTKTEMLLPGEVYTGNALLEEIFPTVYKRYTQVLKNQNLVDFDDLLLLTVNLLEDNKELLEQYQDRYRYLLVDEYQDTNNLQFRLLELLTGNRYNLCVVGDDDQSIYGWRGAKIENILNFPKRFPNVKQIKLEQNYRSNNIILKISNALISCNMTRHDKELWSERGEGKNVRFVEAATAEEEAQFVADTVADIHTGKDFLPYDDIAILYRSNHLSRLFESALRASRIPYRIVGGKSFYERKEVRDAVAYLKLLVNARDDQSLLRIIGAPPRGIGDKAIERLRDLQLKTYIPLSELLANPDFLSQISAKASSGASSLTASILHWKREIAEGGDLAGKIHSYLKDVGYLDGLLKMYKDRDDSERRRENVFELINAVTQYEARAGTTASLDGFIENYCLGDDSDKVEGEEEDAVTLMTIHAAKGLEFSAVFIVGLEENVFPNERSLKEGAIEEERRLFYVAITRAKRILTMSRTRERMRFGSYVRGKRSRFIAELPKDYIEIIDAKDAFKKVSVEELRQALANFSFD